MKKLTIQSGQGSYSVDFFDEITSAVAAASNLALSAIIIDGNVASLYREQLQPLLGKIPFLEIAATEDEKTLSGVARVLSFFQENNLTRNSIVLAIGGGITQDITSFSSHIYYRGIRWAFIPTTLLSMGDSCIGAKCGINFNAYKNQLGVFHSPAHIFVCSQFASTLSERDILSGYGEMLKLILTGSEKSFLTYQEAFKEKYPDLSEANHFIFECLKVKKAVIEADEYELDYRRILNYGHTFGHALESMSNYEIPHGLAVAWGMDMINFLGWKYGFTQEQDFLRLHDFIARYFSLKISFPIDSKKLVDMTRRDKKVTQGKANLVFLRGMGDLVIQAIDYNEKLYDLTEEFLEKYNVFHWD